MGVGGSGKQSLTRLAASVSGLEVFQIQLRKGYAVGDLKVNGSQVVKTMLAANDCMAYEYCIQDKMNFSFSCTCSLQACKNTQSQSCIHVQFSFLPSRLTWPSSILRQVSRT